ncbi:hypothetical protein AMECASPLE_004795 [Ameca splendens]|uniref:Uncharacterized protein n=1 Tax=Ameca splendens TaxID=208324 RepID=A0ABV0YA24_9TELE
MLSNDTASACIHPTGPCLPAVDVYTGLLCPHSVPVFTSVQANEHGAEPSRAELRQGERKWSFVNEGSGGGQKTNFTTLFLQPASIFLSATKGGLRRSDTGPAGAEEPQSCCAIEAF